MSENSRGVVDTVALRGFFFCDFPIRKKYTDKTQEGQRLTRGHRDDDQKRGQQTIRTVVAIPRKCRFCIVLRVLRRRK